jgi:hypothetical protein
MSTVPNATAAPAANNVDAAQSAPVEQKQPVVAADAGKSSLETAQPTESRGFFGTIYDGVASVFTWIKDKFVAIYNFIFGSCSSACEVEAPAQPTDLQKLQAKQARFEQYHKDFKAEGWKDVFNAMPKEDQDLIIKEDMRAIAVHKKIEDADIDAYVESRFKVQDKIDYSLKLVRDLQDDVDYKASIAVTDYLETISQAIGEEIDTLKAQEEKK